MIIGNKKILNEMQILIDNNKCPQSILLVGDNYFGKKYLARHIADLIKKPFMFLGDSIQDFNEMKKEVYGHANGFCYIITDLQNYNYKAIESLLKIIEEPPKNTYFIITCNNEYRIKITIRNRCYILRMEMYQISDLIEYSEYKKYKKLDIWYYSNIVYSPTLIDFYSNGKLEQYEEFVKKFVNNISNVSAGNALKAANQFNMGKDDYDNIRFDLFLNFLSALVLKNEQVFHKNIILILWCIRDYKNQYTINGVDKLSLIKDFILKYRKICIENGIDKITI